MFDLRAFWGACHKKYGEVGLWFRQNYVLISVCYAALLIKSGLSLLTKDSLYMVTGLNRKEIKH